SQGRVRYQGPGRFRISDVHDCEPRDGLEVFRGRRPRRREVPCFGRIPNRQDFRLSNRSVIQIAVVESVMTYESLTGGLAKPALDRHAPGGFRTSAYQIEGAVNEDGRGRSIRDTFIHTPGKIEDKTNGDFANDHYHRYKEDIGLIRELGAKAYRFSIAWPRVFPAGTGKRNPKGL